MSAFQNEVSNHDVTLAVVADDDREQLAQASQLTEALRRQDPSYQSELRWWTSPFNLDEESQATSRLSTSEAGRVDVARAFPPFGHGDRRRRVDIDHSKIVVLCTRDDSRPSVLRCGEALSALLLECANAGLATCTLTHMIEMTPSRDIVRRLVGQTGLPQLLIRVGRAPAGEQQPPATPAAGAGRARVPILDASLSIPYSQGDRMTPGLPTRGEGFGASGGREGINTLRMIVEAPYVEWADSPDTGAAARGSRTGRRCSPCCEHRTAT